MIKKTQKPVEAFVAQVEAEEPNCEKYCIMVKDKNGEIDIQNEKYRAVGDTYFYINKEKQMITPKFEVGFVDGDLCEKVYSHMVAKGNKEFGGIGTRLHQLRVERMLQNGLGNVQIVAEGNSFPFHYAMGYRLRPSGCKIEEAGDVMYNISILNKKPPRENGKYIAVEKQGEKLVINLGATYENFLNDHYKNGGEILEYFSPNMFLDAISLDEWIEMIKKQPILY